MTVTVTPVCPAATPVAVTPAGPREAVATAPSPLSAAVSNNSSLSGSVKKPSTARVSAAPRTRWIVKAPVGSGGRLPPSSSTVIRKRSESLAPASVAV